MKPRLACDLDGVIFDTVPEYIKEINHQTGRNYANDDLCGYSFEETFGLSTDVVWKCISAVLSREAQSVFKDVIQLLTLKRHVSLPILFLTARNPCFAASTRQQLNRVFKGKLPYTLIHSDNKAKICRAANIAYMIEDSPYHAVEIVKESPRTTVLVVKRPYNMGLKHSRIRYIQSLTSVRPIIMIGEGVSDDY